MPAINPYYRTARDIDADTLAPLVDAIMREHNQRQFTINQIKTFMSPEMGALLNRTIMIMVCSRLGVEWVDE